MMSQLIGIQICAARAKNLSIKKNTVLNADIGVNLDVVELDGLEAEGNIVSNRIDAETAHLVAEFRTRNSGETSLTNAEIVELFNLAQEKIPQSDQRWDGLRSKLGVTGSLASIAALAAQILGSMS